MSALPSIRNIALIVLFILVMYFFNNQAGSKLNSKGFSFDNGSGLVTIAPATDGTPRIQALTALMTPSGVIIDENIPTESLIFLATPNMTTKLTARMLGVVSAFAYIPPASSGWLVCDGTAYSRTTYANLFSKIKTVYGNTDGTNFKVPDLRGLFIMGTIEGGTAVGLKNTSTAFQSHTHALSAGSSVSSGGGPHTHTYHNNLGNKSQIDDDSTDVLGYEYFTNATVTTTQPSGAHAHTLDLLTPNLSDSALNATESTLENRPINAAVIYCIYANP